MTTTLLPGRQTNPLPEDRSFARPHHSGISGIEFVICNIQLGIGGVCQMQQGYSLISDGESPNGAR